MPVAQAPGRDATAEHAAVAFFGRRDRSGALPVVEPFAGPGHAVAAYHIETGALQIRQFVVGNPTRLLAGVLRGIWHSAHHRSSPARQRWDHHVVTVPVALQSAEQHLTHLAAVPERFRRHEGPLPAIAARKRESRVRHRRICQYR
ncbi:hypothetical protein [Mycobacterium servetii]|uniref:Uncharacterized protein n=1 Tax=Mycobacterium servetii TaxID=3237418 RepID=A0ABV4C3V8_9MYCO